MKRNPLAGIISQSICQDCKLCTLNLSMPCIPYFNQSKIWKRILNCLKEWSCEL